MALRKDVYLSYKVNVRKKKKFIGLSFYLLGFYWVSLQLVKYAQLILWIIKLINLLTWCLPKCSSIFSMSRALLVDMIYFKIRNVSCKKWGKYFDPTFRVIWSAARIKYWIAFPTTFSGQYPVLTRIKTVCKSTTSKETWETRC